MFRLWPISIRMTRLSEVGRRLGLALVLLPVAARGGRAIVAEDSGAGAACSAITACGGDPTGAWQGAEGAACLAPPRSAPAGPPCDDLVYLPANASTDAAPTSPQGLIEQL